MGVIIPLVLIAIVLSVVHTERQKSQTKTRPQTSQQQADRLKRIEAVQQRLIAERRARQQRAPKKAAQRTHSITQKRQKAQPVQTDAPIDEADTDAHEATDWLDEVGTATEELLEVVRVTTTAHGARNRRQKRVRSALQQMVVSSEILGPPKGWH